MGNAGKAGVWWGWAGRACPVCVCVYDLGDGGGGGGVWWVVVVCVVVVAVCVRAV